MVYTFFMRFKRTSAVARHSRRFETREAAKKALDEIKRMFSKGGPGDPLIVSIQKF